MTASAPLAGVVVVDLSRMLPGAVLARQLLELGARVVKVEEPGVGDPMRHLPPLVDGIGAGFASFFAGAESVTLDLARPEGAAALRRLARAADVLVESYRPGRLAGWDLAAERVTALNPGLVWCSLSAWGREAAPGRVGHDLNLVAESGALELMAGAGLPQIQLADVATGLLAATAILAALHGRATSGRGAILDQPLAVGPLPFVAWARADAAAGGEGEVAALLGGAGPSYRRYRAGDGRDLAVAALEPKLWVELVTALGLPHLAGAGFDRGEDGARAAVEVAAVLAGRPSDHWLALAERHGWPLSRVEPVIAEAPPSFLPSFAGASRRRAPALGEHSAAVRAELGLD